MISRIGKYAIEAELGRGGFGRVYRAHDPDMHRQVAIKVLTESDPELVRRFEFEIDTTASLQHKNIVILYERGQEAGVPYLVMEFVEGRTLEQTIRENSALPLIEKVRIMTQVAEGLAYAHSRGVIHRDVKPGNIMIRPDGSVKVMDFGIARQTSRDTLHLTREGFLIGTIPYMAPEQFEAGAKADQQTDIFSYGDVYYEFLTGKHPFSIANDIPATIARIRAIEPESISRVFADCPESLELIVHRALAKEREIRYSTMAELLLDSEGVIADLRHEQAEAILHRIRPLIDAGDFENAEHELIRVAELEPGNREARELRKAIGREREQRAVARKITELLDRGEQQIRTRRFNEAVETLEGALRMDSGNQSVIVTLETARARFHACAQANKLVAEARRDQQQGNLERAFERLKKAVELDPEHPDAQMLVSRVRNELDRRVREHRVNEALGQAMDLLAQRRYDDALKIVAPLLEEKPVPERVNDVRLRIEQEKEQSERRRREERFSELVSSIRRALQARDSQAAGERLRELEAAPLPTSSAAAIVEQLRSEVGALLRAGEVGAFSEQARGLLGRKAFGEAIDLLDEALRRFPGDPGLERLRESAISQQRTEAVAAVLKEAGALRDGGQLEAGLEAISRGQQHIGDDPALRDFRAHLQTEMDQQRYAATLRDLVDSARMLIREGRHADAIAALEQGGQFRGEAEVASLLAAARTGDALARERQAEKVALARVDALEAQGDVEGALAALEQARRVYPHNAVLSQRAERLRSAIEEEQRNAREAAYHARIQGSIRMAEWESAEKLLRVARTEFPAAFGDLEEQIRRALFDRAVERISSDVRQKLGAGRIQQAQEEVERTRTLYAADPRWKLLEDEVERHRDYESGLARADDLRKRGDLGAAEEELTNLIEAGTLDDRATGLRDEVRDGRIAGEIARAKEAVRRRDFDGAQRVLDELRGWAPAAWATRIEEASQGVGAARQDLIENERRAHQARIAGEVRSIRDHLARGQPEKADAALLQARSAFPDEGVWEGLQKEIAVAAEAKRAEAAAREEQALVKSALADAQAFQLRREWQKAIQTLEPALARYPQNADLQKALERIKARAAEEAHRKRIEEHRAKLEAALSANDLARATAALADARKDFPGEALFDVFEERLKQAALDAALAGLTDRVRQHFATDDLASAERELETARKKYGRLRSWQDLERELGARRSWLEALSEARQLLAAGEFDRAESELRKLIAGPAIDERASGMLGEVLDASAARELQKAQASLAEGRAEEALARLDRLGSVARDRRAADIGALRKEAQRQIGEHRERERLQKKADLDHIVETLRGHLANDDVQTAGRELQAGESRYPGEELWPALRSEIAARTQELDQFKREWARARELLADAPAEAVAILERLRSGYPAREEIAADLSQAREQLREHQFQTLARDVEQLCASGRFAEARRRIAEATPEQPGVPALGERIGVLEAEAAKRRLAGEIDAARQLCSSNPRGAVERLEKVREEFAGRAEFEEALEECRHALDKQERDETFREIGALCDRRRYAAARTKLETASARFAGDGRLVELGARIDSGLAERPPARRIPFRTVAWAGGGLALAAIAAAGLMLSRGHTPPPVTNTASETPVSPTPVAAAPGQPNVAPPPSPSTVPSSGQQGTLIVETRVPSADVFIDGQPAAQTNAKGTARLVAALGEHTIRISRTGFDPAEMTATVQPGSRRVHMDLKPMQTAGNIPPQAPPPAKFTPPSTPPATKQQEPPKQSEVAAPPKIAATAAANPGPTVATLQPPIAVPQPTPAPPPPARAPEKPPSPAASQGTNTGDAQAVRAALARYAAAFKAENIEELKHVFPAAAGRLQQAFHDPRASVLNYSISPTSEPVIKGDAANVEAVQTLQWSRQNAGRTAGTFVLHRENGQWIITEFRH